MALEKAEGFAAPNAAYEQYQTPAAVAAPFLHLAFMSGDIEGKTVYDLGCGTGILSIGAALLGASAVSGFDVDANAVSVARKNAARLGAEIGGTPLEFEVCDIARIPEKIQAGALKRADTIVMNPPFGAQAKGNDRPFLEAALAAGRIVYSIHNKGSRAFIEKFIKPAVITDCFITDFPIRKTFDFHTQEVRTIAVEIYRIDSSPN